MLRRTRSCLHAAIFLALLALQSRPAMADTAPVGSRILGTWILVSVQSQQADGTQGEPFGPSPRGIIMFSSDGHFSLFQSRAELPRLAANDRTRATPEEAMTVVRDSIAYYGTYAVDEAGRSISMTLEGSTYANLQGGPAQRRIVTTLTATELQFSNPRTPSGMTLHTVWRRAPSQ
ncbi:lipocalin-like domain-containing protein [Neoroseomonas rubea]|uniref:lipocalin-like domain-containing protein n=1 Tax=Neoroseomonas rubea TaxID=2748666 RepID=UPI0018DFCFD0|nr:lipocalin-like domain-containing protein [Roseomonas rubea]